MVDFRNLKKIAVDPETGIILDKQAIADTMDAMFIANGYEVGKSTMTAKELERV